MEEIVLFHIQVGKIHCPLLFCMKLFLNQWYLQEDYYFFIDNWSHQTKEKNPEHKLRSKEQPSDTKYYGEKIQWWFYPPRKYKSCDTYRKSRLDYNSPCINRINTKMYQLIIVVPFLLVYQKYPQIMYLNLQNIQHINTI